MVSVDEMEAAFPDVDRSVFETIADRMDDPPLHKVADVLTQAGKKGKVPEKDYNAELRKQGESASISEEDLPEGVTKEEYVEWKTVGEAAERKMKSEGDSLKQRIKQADKEHDIGALVKYVNEIDDLSNKMLMKPDRNTVTDDVELLSTMAATALSDAVELRIRDGEPLDKVRDHLYQIQQDDLRDSLIRHAETTHDLKTNSGSEYQKARTYVLNEENNAADVLSRLDDVRQGMFDVTHEQVEEIVEDAEDWLREYQELAERAE